MTTPDLNWIIQINLYRMIIKIWCHLLSYLILFDKLMLSYVNKELYFIIHANKKFEKELNFYKTLTSNNDWKNFLKTNLNDILKKFKLIFNPLGAHVAQGQQNFVAA